MSRCEWDDCDTCPYPDCIATIKEMREKDAQDKGRPIATIKKSINMDAIKKQKHDYYMRNKERYKEWNKKSREKKRRVRKWKKLIQ